MLGLKREYGVKALILDTLNQISIPELHQE